jgi:Tetratricopeptide repeat
VSLTILQVSGTASTSGSATSIDPKGYLTSLDSQVIKTEAEIGDIKRARMLFDSLIKSNPKHAPGWIAAAALEEHAGRMVAARKLIKQGCEQCPKSEDVWLEAARLHVGRFSISSRQNGVTLSYSKMTMQRLFSPMLYSTLGKALKSGWRLRTLSMILKRKSAYCGEV